MMRNEFTGQDLIEAGYRRFSNVHNRAECGFEKKVYGDEGRKLYFIHICQYKFDFGESFSAEFQFHFKNKEGFVDITLSAFQTIKEIEDFAEDFYTKFDCRSYD